MEHTKENPNMDLCDNLWNQYEPKLRRLCGYKLSNYPTEVDEVISKTYLALCEAISKGTEFDDPKSWLYQTANNQIKLKYTEINTRKRRFVSLEQVEAELMYNIDFDDIQITDVIIEELSAELQDELSENEKLLLELRYEKNLKLKQIATIIGTTEAGVKQQHYRLKRKVKKLANEKTKNYK